MRKFRRKLALEHHSNFCYGVFGMKLEQQVVSLELAKKLKELGVKQFGTLFAWAEVAQKEKDYLGRPLWKYQIVKNNFQADIEFIAAFTVAELGELLPWCVNKKSEMPFCLEIRKMIADVDNDEWTVRYIRGKNAEEQIPVTDDTEANARAKMLIYLLENKLLESENNHATTTLPSAA